MNTELSAHAGQSFDKKQMQLLTDTIMQGASGEEVSFFAEVCKRAGLDPFRKQIHAVERWNAKLKRMVWSYQTGIDGFRAIAGRTGLYAGSDDAAFLPADESASHPTKASVTVWKLVGGSRVPFTASARWSEYVQTKKDGAPNSMWNKMPYGQLAKCAEALALRKAFPEELSGLHSEEEMQQADNPAEAKNATSVDLSPRNFEEPAEPASQALPEPEPTPREDKEHIPVPESLANLVGGEWKKEKMENGKPLGSVKVGDLRKMRNDPPMELVNALYASTIDEVLASLRKRKKTVHDLADAATRDGLIDSPAELWANPENYSAILDACPRV